MVDGRWREAGGTPVGRVQSPGAAVDSRATMRLVLSACLDAANRDPELRASAAWWCLGREKF